MRNSLDRLSSEDREFLMKAPILVSILIAGADGKIDRSEIQEGMKQAKNNQKTTSAELMELYDEVGSDFEDKLKIVLQGYPVKGQLRNKAITEELVLLNDFWPKLDDDFSKAYYQSLRDLALSVAQSSGGILGMNTIGAEEAKYINLPMIKDPSAN
ncbi:MAG: hypothetical protein OJF59_003314 [Cytophagales bacterium]|jgi:hypothetical protein|nr:hypothetical protein [Bacteroidota bacterium]MBS1982154.1 hypothetical protein [Bacteroidota bacterium]WHZ09558.1 MAG: hypothetical protein OJF59_003314 [Cytophagales bacterium]